MSSAVQGCHPPGEPRDDQMPWEPRVFTGLLWRWERVESADKIPIGLLYGEHREQIPLYTRTQWHLSPREVCGTVRAGIKALIDRLENPQSQEWNSPSGRRHIPPEKDLSAFQLSYDFRLECGLHLKGRHVIDRYTLKCGDIYPPLTEIIIRQALNSLEEAWQ